MRASGASSRTSAASVPPLAARMRGVVEGGQVRAGPTAPPRPSRAARSRRSRRTPSARPARRARRWRGTSPRRRFAERGSRPGPRARARPRRRPCRGCRPSRSRPPARAPRRRGAPSRRTAPRILKEPVSWRHSSFSATGTPAISESPGDSSTGVRRTRPAIARRASATRARRERRAGLTSGAPTGAAIAVAIAPRTRSASRGASAAVRPCDRNGREDRDGGRRGLEDERVLRKRVLGPGHGERNDVDAELDREAEGSLAKRRDRAVGAARAFREDDHRASARQPVAHGLDRLLRAVLVAALDRDVPRGPHLPAEERDLEDRVLREKLHLPRQQAQQEDVGERLVVGDEEMRPSRVGVDVVDRPEVPERVDARGERGRVALEAADPVAVGIGAVREEDG